MLVECVIKNLAVIEYARVQFGQGFHVLTGETGAGKSMIIDALSLIAGGRGSADLVRHGSGKAEIECLFEVAEHHPVWHVLKRHGIEASREEYLTIRREVSASGKSSARVNGQLVSLSMLREIGETLVNIHGQHEHQILLKSDSHLDWLDLYGGKEIGELKNRYFASYQKYSELQKQLEQLENMSKTQLQMLDLYRFQIEEIAAARLAEGEDEQLQLEKQKLANAEKIAQAIAESYEMLYGSRAALELTGMAMNRLEHIKSYDPAVYEPIWEQIQNAYYQLEDAAFQLRNLRDQVEFQPERLNEVEHRLDLISSLRRKYGNSIREILQYADQIRQQLETMENKEEKIAEIRSLLDAERGKMAELAGQLTEKRKTLAKQLAEQAEKQLKDLHMERTRFHVQIDVAADFTKNGRDAVEFLLAPNPGEPLKPLAKIASGGELSRIMLALKTIFAEMDRIPVLVFDEVDTGVSGRAAQAIAEKLSDLSRHCQVFAITHLPQVACMADVHIAINKFADAEKTYTAVRVLPEEERIKELARMLGGAQVTQTTEHHAKEMLDMAAQIKERRNHLQL